MPRNSQGNHYSTPGGTNSSSGTSYHYSNTNGSYCAPLLFILSAFAARWPGHRRLGSARPVSELFRRHALLTTRVAAHRLRKRQWLDVL
jgi:hypothetical protein